MNTLPVQRAHQLDPIKPEHQWLIEGLWAMDSVGIVGGEPKSCKSFMVLSMAVAVCSRRPCLDHYPVPKRGRVLLFAAEDALHIVRQRLVGICSHHGVRLDELDLWVITAATVRLDINEDRDRLVNTVVDLKPILLILDPFVRLHRVDENVSSAVAPLLAFLRDIQRQNKCSVVLVHHGRKGASKTRAGQALRGTSEFHAWYDTGLYLQRKRDAIQLSIEHRAQLSPEPIAVELKSGPESIALVVATGQSTERNPVQTPIVTNQERVLAALRTQCQPVRNRQLRAMCSMRMVTLCNILNKLTEDGLVENTGQGWMIRPTQKSTRPRKTSTSRRQQIPFPFPSHL